MKNIMKIIPLIVSIFLMNAASARLAGENGARKVNLFASSEKLNKMHYSIFSLKDDDGDDDDVAAAYIGIRYMPTFTALSYQKRDNSTVETTLVLGHGFGGLLGFNLGNHVGVQVEAIYSSLAQRYKQGDYVADIKLQYINIPLLLVLNTGFNKPVNFNVALGPQLGLNVGSTIDGSGNGMGTDTVNAKLAVKKGDLGVAYGAGLDFGLGESAKLSIGFRGVYGLVDISDNSNNLETNDYYVLDKAHVKTYAGYIGFTFAF